MVSSNDGEDWFVNSEFDNMMVKVDSLKTFIIGKKGFYSSADNGMNWTRVSNGTNLGSVSKSSIVLKNGVYTIYSICNDSRLMSNYLTKSINEGEQWTNINLPDNNLLSAVKANPLNPEIVYVGCNSGLYKSSNGGISWKQILTTNSTPSITAIEIFLNDTSHILVGSKGKIFESFSSGDSWQILPLNMNNSDYQVNNINSCLKNPKIICVSTSSENSIDRDDIFISTNGGNSWEKKNYDLSIDINHLIITAIAFDPTNEDNIFIGNYSGVYRTKDRGNRWLSYSDLGYVTDIKIAQDNPKLIFVTTKGITYDGTGGLYLLKDADNYSEEISLPDLTKESRSSIDIFPVGNKYKIFVGTASHGYYEGEYSRQILFPQQPLIISPNNINKVPRKPILLWHPSDLAMQYHIQIAEDTLFSSIVYDTTVTDTTIEIDNLLAANTYYYWQVKAINIYGDTVNSLIANFTTGTIVGIKDKADNKPNIFALVSKLP